MAVYLSKEESKVSMSEMLMIRGWEQH